MSQLPSHARVVIIGGGAVGVSSLYHLAKAGWHDVLLLEKNELTAGSTWHAAGNVPTFSTSWSIMNMQRYSTELYRGLAQEVDYPMNYHVTGSIRLAHSQERMQEFHRAKGMGDYQGMELAVLSPSEILAKYPFIALHDVKGALFDPADGDIDPAQLTQALAKGARQNGATIARFTEVTAIDRVNGEWLVKTNQGDVRCEIIVNAAGYYAGKVAKMFYRFGGRPLPMMVMSHQYLISEPIAEIEAWSKAQSRKLPLLRDVDTSYYLRQEKFGFNLGPYERNCRAHWVNGDDPMPDDFSFQLFPDDLDRLEYYMEEAFNRVPLLQKAGIAKVINGPIPYTPDGNPLIGPMPGVANAFEACVFTFGIAQAGGAGKVLAEWVTKGATEWDMWSCDPRRFTGFTNHDYCVAKGLEVYGHEYAIHFPYHRWPAGANQKLSPLHDSLTTLGGQFGAYNGWERVNYFAKPGDDTSAAASQNFRRRGPWHVRIKEECEAVRDEVGVLDLCGFSRFRLHGKGASQFLLSKIAGKLPAINRVGLAYFADERGRLITEMSVFRHDVDDFTLITAAVAEWHDYEWIKRDLPPNLTLSNETEAFETLIVSGPKSRALMSSLGKADWHLPWLSLQKAELCGVATDLARVSFAGELGWEIHAAPHDIPKLYQSLLDGGAKPFGMWALNSLRLEKGYKAWKQDLSSDYSLLELGLDRFIDWHKAGGFVGQAALAQEQAQGRRQQMVSLAIKGGDCDAPYMANVMVQGNIIGSVTSAAWGFRVGGRVGMAMIQSAYCTSNQEVTINIYGEEVKATVQPNIAQWDPQNQRLTA